MTKIKTYRWNATPLTTCVALFFLLTFATEDSALAAPRSIRQADAVTTSTPAPGANQSGTTPRVRILVQPKNTIAEDQLQNVFAGLDARQEDIIQQINVRILSVPEQARDRVLDALSHRPDIEFAEADTAFAPALIPNDTYYPNEWHLAKLQSAEAWDITTGDSSVVIAILDTGVDGSHTDLAAKMVPGWNFYDNNSDTADLNGHGTAVAGTAAAISNNGTGVSSLAWGCKVMPIRVADASGWATSSAIANGLTWAADNGARVANISFAVSTSSTVTSAAQYFQSKGGVVAVSAGNNGINYSDPDNPYMLTVSATDANDVLATWSTTGNNIDLAAPGVGIVTTAMGGGYASGSGTSFSAPIVAGVAALIISVNPALTALQAQDILKQSADDLGAPGWDASYGFGRVNAYQAVLLATGTPPADTTAPSALITAPAAGTMAGVVSVDVSATDNVGVTKVEWYANGTLMGTSSSATASFLWDTTQSLNGSYNLQIVAYDAAGNFGTSAAVTVSVQNAVLDTTAPTAQITSPAAGSTLSGIAIVSINATDAVGVTKIEYYANGGLAGTSFTSAATFSWNTTGYPNGVYTIQAKAYDAAGNVGTSVSVAVNIQNATVDSTPPTVQITSPATGSTVTKSLKIYVAAGDNVGVTRVNLYLDGKSYASITASPYVFTCNTSKLARGQHTFKAFAYDAAGNVGSSTVVTVTK